MPTSTISTVLVDPLSTTDHASPPVSRVFVGIDGSGPSGDALRWAMHNAPSPDAELVVVHVVDGDWELLGSDYLAEADRRGATLLEEAMRSSREWWTGPVRSLLKHGCPAETLAALASEQDLIVIGSHKTGYLHGLALGSTSVQLIAVACSSVAVIPNVPLNQHCLVVVGVSGSDASMAAVHRAALEAGRCGHPLAIVHARRTFPVAWNSPEMPENVESAKRIVSRAARIALAAAPELEVTTRIVSQPIGVALLKACQGATLLVLGAGAPGSNTRIEPVIHDVAMNLAVPLLVARDPQYVESSDVPTERKA